MNREQMIENFDIDAWEKTYYSAGSHKDKNVLDSIKQRIKDLTRWNPKDPEINYLMGLAVLFKYQQQQEMKSNLRDGIDIGERVK